MVVRLIGPIPIWHMSCDWLPISYYRQYSSCIPLQYSRLLLCCQNDPGNLSGKSQCPFSPIRPLFKSTLAPTWICFSVITELILSGVVVHSQLVCLLSLRILHLVMFHLNNSFLSPQAFLPSSKNPQFQNESRCTTFLVKLSFICMRMKNISISKAEHLTSFWWRGPGELRNGLLWYISYSYPISSQGWITTCILNNKIVLSVY